jgi:hypothetical protein
MHGLGVSDVTLFLMSRIYAILFSAVWGMWRAFKFLSVDHHSLDTTEILSCPWILIDLVVTPTLMKMCLFERTDIAREFGLFFGNGLVYGLFCYAMCRVFLPRK